MEAVGVCPAWGPCLRSHSQEVLAIFTQGAVRAQNAGPGTGRWGCGDGVWEVTWELRARWCAPRSPGGLLERQTVSSPGAAERLPL